MKPQKHLKMGELVSPVPNEELPQTPDLTPIRPNSPIAISRRTVLLSALGAGGLLIAQTPLAEAAASLTTGTTAIQKKAPGLFAPRMVYPFDRTQKNAIAEGGVVTLGDTQYFPAGIEQTEDGVMLKQLDQPEEGPSLYQSFGESEEGMWLWINIMGQDTQNGCARGCASMVFDFFDYDMKNEENKRILKKYIRDNAYINRTVSGSDKLTLQESFAERTDNALRGDYLKFRSRDWRDVFEEHIRNLHPVIALIPRAKLLAGPHNFDWPHYVVMTGSEKIADYQGGAVFFNSPWPVNEGSGYYLRPNKFEAAWSSEYPNVAHGWQGVAVKKN